MAETIITEHFSTVNVPKNEYEDLVRDSEILSTIERYVQESTYVSTETLKIILGIKVEKECEE